MADALTAIPIAVMLVIWSRVFILYFLLSLRIPMVVAAIAEQRDTVSREHPQGDDGDEEAGAKMAHGANT